MITILIAEDDAIMAHLYQKAFTFEGYQVQLASDGQDALDKAHANPPSIIILDVMMPRLNGIDALGQLKADPQLKHIPVIMLTNLADQQDAQSALEKGALQYITKSQHDPQEVAGIIKKVLQPPEKSDLPRG